MPMKNMSRQTRFHVGYWIAAILGLLALQYFYTTAQKVAAIPYSQFEQLLRDHKIAEVGVSDRYIQGRLKEPLNGKSQFVTTRVDPRFADELQKYGVTFTGEVESTLVTDLLSWVVPALLFFGVWMFLSRRVAQGLGGGSTDFPSASLIMNRLPLLSLPSPRSITCHPAGIFPASMAVA